MNNRRRQVSTIVIALLMAGLVIGVVPTCYAKDETDVFILPVPPLPPFFSDFNITPTEIELGDYIIISFVIENTNNQSITWLSANQIGDITQIIAIELENYESKNIWYRIIPHAAGEYDVWIDGMTGSFNVTSITPEPDPLEELKEDITQAFNIIDGVVAEIIVDGHELGGRVDVLETHSTEVIEQIEYLENEISRLKYYRVCVHCNCHNSNTWLLLTH